MYTTVITQDIYKINTKIMELCYKEFISLCQHANMNEHFLWLRHCQGRLMLFLGGNVYNVMLHVNSATLRVLTSLILCLL